MEDKKIVPYQTSTGLMIGRFYRPAHFCEHNSDMDLIQQALIGNNKGRLSIITKDFLVATAAAFLLILALWVSE